LLTMHAVPVKTQHILAATTKFVIMKLYQGVFKIMPGHDKAGFVCIKATAHT